MSELLNYTEDLEICIKILKEILQKDLNKSEVKLVHTLIQKYESFNKKAFMELRKDLH